MEGNCLIKMARSFLREEPVDEADKGRRGGTGEWGWLGMLSVQIKEEKLRCTSFNPLLTDVKWLVALTEDYQTGT